MLPMECEVRPLGGDLEVYEEEASRFVIAPIAVGELVSDAQAMHDAPEGIAIELTEPGGGINRAHQRVGGFQSGACRSNTIEGGNHQVAEVSRFASVVADSDL